MAHINHDSAKFWEGCQQRELRIARCQDCGAWIHLPRRICPECWSDEIATEVVDGAGHLLTYSLPRVPTEATEPMITGVVALDGADGVRMLTRIVGCAPDRLSIGLPVMIDWRNDAMGIVPQFRPLEEGS